MILLIGELDERDMRIYIKISLAGFCVTRTSLNIGVSFKTIKPVKNWEKTPHFMFGNLLCLSPTGNFKVIFLFLKCIYLFMISIVIIALFRILFGQLWQIEMQNCWTRSKLSCFSCVQNSIAFQPQKSSWN